MKRLAVVFLLAAAATASGAYQYYFNEQLPWIDVTKWHINGPAIGSWYGLNTWDQNGASIISKVPVPDGTSDYEAKMTLNLYWGAPGGTYALLLRATPDARPGPSAKGAYYSVELQNPTFFQQTACTATLAIYKRVEGVVTLLSQTPATCHNGTTVRAVRSPSRLEVFVDNVYVAGTSDSSIATGAPGIAVYGPPGSGSGIAPVAFGLLDRISPNAIDRGSISVLSLSSRVELRWQGVTDDPNGTGLWKYRIYRDGAYVADSNTPGFIDAGAQPSVPYRYDLYASDCHGNLSNPTSITVTTPPPGATEPRRVGTRPLGTYWGGAGEQIDLLSGNLNYAVPLLKAMGRGGWGVQFALSYNSQLWRENSGLVSKLGLDIGYGFGWRLLAGSLTPYWADWQTIQFFIFTDSTGAEYRLDVNTNGVWTSRQGVYVEYDSAASKLYFPDGSSWLMGAVSAGGEQDAGTRYPTLMQDTNGNQVLIRYYPGLGVPWPDSSARIKEIEDVRATLNGSAYSTYTFAYNSDPIPHLVSISNSISSGEAWDFGYLAGQPLSSPFPPYESYGTTTLLQQLTSHFHAETHTFEYPGGAGELGKVSFPYGGWLRWIYRPFTYLGNQTLREVQYRYLSKSSGAAEATYYFQHDDASWLNNHLWTVLHDPSGAGKGWVFDTSGLGVLLWKQERVTPHGTALRHEDYTYAYDAAGNVYRASTTATIDPGMPYARQSKTEQTLDIHGNVAETRIYDYGSGTPTRTYVHSYLADPNYTSRRIWNRLVSTTVNGTLLVSNTYDHYASITDRPGLRQHAAAFGTAFTFRGNVTRRVALGSIANLQYDIGGALVSADDGYGHALSVAATSATNYAAPSTVTPNATATLATSYTYDTALAVTSVTQPNNAVSSTSYDAAGRPSQVTSVHGAVTTYSYSGNQVTASVNQRWTRTTLDGLGRTVKVETGDAGGAKTVVDYEYDSSACSPLGKLRRICLPA